MATGPEHYREAERLAEAYKSALSDVEAMPMETDRQRLDRMHAAGDARALLDKAQVHATLALAAATAYLPRSTTTAVTRAAQPASGRGSSDA